jgi:hypothetical protein
MAFLNLDTELITEETLRELSDKTNVTYLSPGSKARLLLDIMNDKLGIQAEQFDSNVGKAFIRNADGKLLDFIGEIFGVSRALKEKAEISKEEKNFFFYTLENNFGEINGFEDIIIPRNSIKIFNTEDEGEEQIFYTNTEEIILSAIEDRVFFSAEAKDFGSGSNVGSGTLNFHDYTGYADATSRTLLVSNSASITYGEDDESDENYRFKIQQQTIAGEAGNFSALRLNLLSVSGISDVVRIKYPRGIGTSDWLIKAVTPEVPERLIELAQQSIDEKESSGLENTARSPVTIGLQLQFSITYRSRLEDSTKDLIKTTARRKVIEYVNGLDIGEALIIDQLTKIVLNADERILSIGDANSTANFERITIFKRSAVSNSTVKRTIIGDYKTKSNERVIVEPTIIDPIIITDNN